MDNHAAEPDSSFVSFTPYDSWWFRPDRWLVRLWEVELACRLADITIIEREDGDWFRVEYKGNIERWGADQILWCGYVHAKHAFEVAARNGGEAMSKQAYRLMQAWTREKRFDDYGNDVQKIARDKAMLRWAQVHQQEIEPYVMI